MWEKLKDYWETYQPIEWVFEGQNGGQYSDRSVQAIFTAAQDRSRINPLATTSQRIVNRNRLAGQ